MKMKKILLLFFAVICIVSIEKVNGQEYSNALGIRLSTAQATINQSVSYRRYINENTAIEGLLSFDPIAVGVLYEKIYPLGAPGLQWFFGGGAYVAFKGDNVIGAMGIVGLDYTFSEVPINLSLDWKPELNFINNVNFQASAVALSIRFVF
jgi:hypothetical protein